MIETLRARGLWPGSRQQTHGARPQSYKGEPITDWYEYQDSHRLRYIVCRTASKQFPCFHPSDDSGAWKAGFGSQRILYRLPELLTADLNERVLLVEGETDTDRASAEGFVATTTPGGAGKAHLCDLSPLRNRHVVIIPDNDVAGSKQASDLVSLLGGIAASVMVIHLPGLPEKGDPSDYFDAGRHR